jgi:SAM-dependent methyltransferase
VHSVPRLFPKTIADNKIRRTRSSFAWEWDRYPGSLQEDRNVFLEETQIPLECWKGSRVLDMGCGMGRYSQVALNLGAEVVAFDLSDALFRMAKDIERQPKLHLVQGDISQPPFQQQIFDIVFSQGVLHHTRNTEQSFQQAAPLVRNGGLMSIWVYGRPGGYSSFATNPLRPGREWLGRIRPLVWVVVWARLLFSGLIRLLTTHMPAPLLYALCYPLAWIGAIPGLRCLTFSAHPNFRVRVHENFDWLAPPYQHKHTKEEVRAWFDSVGFSRLKVLPHGFVPKIGILGTKT